MKQTKLRAIDGTQKTVAPQPVRGLAKLVYQVVKELGGASEQQIKKYLPAVTDDADQYINKKKFDACLYSCVYSGYLITDGSKYRIAPRSYYEARQEVVASNKARHLSGETKRDPKETIRERFVYERPLWHWWILASVGVITACVGYIGGLVTGLLWQIM